MMNAIQTFLLVFLVMGGMRFFEIEIFQNVWMEAIAMGIIIAGFSFLIETLISFIKVFLSLS